MTRHKGLRSIAAAVQASTNEAVCENSQIGGIGAGLPTPLFEDRFRQAHLGQHAAARASARGGASEAIPLAEYISPLSFPN